MPRSATPRPGSARSSQIINPVFDAIYNDPNEVTRVRIEFLETAQLIDLWDKDEDCA